MIYLIYLLAIYIFFVAYLSLEDSNLSRLEKTFFYLNVLLCTASGVIKWVDGIIFTKF